MYALKRWVPRVRTRWYVTVAVVSILAMLTTFLVLKVGEVREAANRTSDI